MKEIPRFVREQLNPRLASGDLGDAFQRFVHELLEPDYLGLYVFPGAGKDGGIDLIQEAEGRRTVIECKQISKDGLPETRRRWRNVAAKLKANLTQPGGPPERQRQYGPWYRKDVPIRRYLFCTSSTLDNQNQIDQLQQEIADFFAGLAGRHVHLGHLTRLQVDILDWNRLVVLFQKRPQLVFRWFPKTRPQGLVPLEDFPAQSTFRSYLASNKLPYYSLAQHLSTVPPPPGVEIVDEERMLASLETGGVTGLVISGRGGLGKTRLALEIGRLAAQRGWFVLRVHSRLREGALDRLAEKVTPSTRVLLVLDYVETQKDFGDLVETLNVLNDTYALHLCYVASCRTTYYQTIVATARHHQIELSPISGQAGGLWLRGYRYQAVRHILEQGELHPTERHLHVCRDIPVLAVFLSYLHDRGREPDLTELLQEADFGTWVARRVQFTFGPTVIARDLALLITLFPLIDPATGHLIQQYSALMDRLAADGWIERLSGHDGYSADMWVTAHDVLADQILLSYLRGIADTIERFVGDLLALACSVGALRSALVSL